MKRLFSLLLALVLALGLTLPTLAADPVSETIAPSGMAKAGDTVYIADSYNRCVWTWKDGNYTLLSGRTDIVDLSGQPVAGYNDGPLSEAAFSEPWAIVPYLNGLLVSDPGNHVIRYLNLAEGRVDTAVGTGSAGNRNGTGRQAAFDTPTGLAVDDEGTVYIADTGNNVIRAMDASGNVTTYAGGAEGCTLGSLQEARFSGPTGLCWADGVLYVADTGNHRVVAIADGQATLVAGAELTGDAAYEGAYLNDVPEKARFSSPQGVTVGADGTIYIADTGNGAVRVVKDGFVSTLLGMDADAASPVSPRGLLLDGDTLYVGDIFSRVLLTASAQAPDFSFRDVADDAWYAPAVRFAAANDLFQGDGDGNFSPEAAMSRAMIWTVLARYDGVDTSSGSTWYEAGQAWATEIGVSDGSNPHSTITREQLAAMLYRYAQSQGQGFTGTWMFPLDYADAGQVSSYAYEAMCWTTMNGILNGVGDNRLDPQGIATRAEVAAILMRYCEGLA